MMSKGKGKGKSGDGLFDGRHFDREIIVLCVRWYLRYNLSLSDLVEMMAERGLSLAYTTALVQIGGLNLLHYAAQKSGDR